MTQFPDQSNSTFNSVDDPNFTQQVQRLYRMTVYGRWFVVAILWGSIGLLSLWSLRSEIALWRQHFTWVAVRYALIYNRFSTLGLGLCIGMTAAVLVWQSRNILWGLPTEEQNRLEQQVHRIRKQGTSHPLWKWIFE
jgi:hypothetical protein